MMSITHDKNANEIVIHTPQGMLLINECKNPNFTRVVMLPKDNGYVSMSDGQPAIMAMWAGVQIAAEPLGKLDDTQEMPPLVIDEVEGQGL